MLNYKTHFETLPAVAIRKALRIYFGDMPEIDAVLELPSPEEVRSLIEPDGKLSIASTIKLVDGHIAMDMEDELARLESKRQRYETSPDFLGKLSDIAFLANDEVTAREAADAAFNIRPDYAARYRLATLLIEGNEVQEATGVLEGGKPEEEYFVALRLAQLKVAAGDLDEAERIIDTAIDFDPQNYRGLMFRGAISMARGKWQEAIGFFREALEEDGRSSVLLFNMAVAQWLLGNGERALRTLKQAVTVNPLNEDAVVFLIQAARCLGKPLDALFAVNQLFDFEKVSPVFLSHATLLYLDASAKRSNGRNLLIKAKACVQRRLKNQETVELWNDLGAITNALGDPRSAHRYFSKSVQLARGADNVDMSLPLSNILSLFIDSRKYDVVREVTGQLFATGISDYGRFTGKLALQHAVTLEAGDDRDGAAEFIESALENIDVYPLARVEMLIHLTNYYAAIRPDNEKLSQHVAALESALTAIDESRDELSVMRARNNIAFSYLQLGLPEMAEAVVRDMGSYVGKEPFSTATAGLFLLKIGKKEKALELYEKAIAMIDDKSVKAKFRQRRDFEFGRYEVEAGRQSEGLKLLEKAEREKFGFSFVSAQARKELARLTKSH